jgi:hypothetical protein
MGVKFSRAVLKANALAIDHRCSILTNKDNNDLRAAKKKVCFCVPCNCISPQFHVIILQFIYTD